MCPMNIALWDENVKDPGDIARCSFPIRSKFGVLADSKVSYLHESRVTKRIDVGCNGIVRPIDITDQMTRRTAPTRNCGLEEEQRSEPRVAARRVGPVPRGRTTAAPVSEPYARNFSETVDFYRRAALLLGRRTDLHRTTSSHTERLRTFTGLCLKGAYPSTTDGSLGHRALLEDASMAL